MKLLRCVLCGSEDLQIEKFIQDNKVKYYHVRCSECGESCDLEPTEHEAIRTWNKLNKENNYDRYDE